MNIEHISVSRSQVWIQCEQQYKFKYHLKLASLEPEQPYFAYGKLIHKIIEEHTESRGQKDIAEIKRRLVAGDTDDPELAGRNLAQELPPEYMKRLNGELLSYLQLARQIGTDGLCEWSFNYDLDPPNGRCVYGFIDRLIQRDDKFYIIDYKTTKKGFWRKNAQTIQDDLQLQCYAFIVSDTFKVPPENIKAALYYLQGGNLVAAQFNRKSLDRAKDKLLSIFKKIEEADADKVRGNVGDHCRRCDYRRCCSFYSLT